jgi:hypothetical protein
VVLLSGEARVSAREGEEGGVYKGGRARLRRAMSVRGWSHVRRGSLKSWEFSVVTQAPVSTAKSLPILAHFDSHPPLIDSAKCL